MKTQTITIIGLSKTGVSVAMAIQQSSLEVSLIGHDPDAALAKEVKDNTNAFQKMEWNLANAVQKADIVVLTIPAVELEKTLQVIGTELQAHTLVLDFSPLKQLGIKWAEQYLQQGHYVGAISVLAAAYLADGRSDLTSASPELFRNSVFCLMPSHKADPDAVETAVNFGLLLGARPYFVNPEEYDQLVQGTETLPRLTAVALFNALSQQESWRDVLRFAGAPFTLSTASLAESNDIVQMALNDRQATLRWMDAFIAELAKVRQWVHDGEPEVMEAILEELENDRRKWLAQRKKNDWDERDMPQVRQRTLGEQMLGGLAARQDDDES